MSQHGLSFFPHTSIDHAVAGIGAGTAAVLCMHPLDLLKVNLQVRRTSPNQGLGQYIYGSLRTIYQKRGIPGLYRGVGANIVGNASSWGLYFLLYTALKRRISESGSRDLTPSDFLLSSATASAATAIVTNPIWVVKVRMFTTKPDSPGAYSGLWNGLTSIAGTEGYRGLWRGTWLALFGVSNGVVQFTTYEQLKKWGFTRKRQQFEASGMQWTELDDRLSNTAYTAMSAFSKIFALAVTYPYQVVRSRLQNNATQHLYPNFRDCVHRTWIEEGASGFYRGLGTNLVRVIPGTCVTFVVYENLAFLFKTQAAKRAART